MRTIDAPDKVFLPTSKAAAWLGLDRRMFLALTREFSDWLRPIPLSLSPQSKRVTHYWDWLDLVCLRHILQRRQEGVNSKVTEHKGT